MPIIEGALGTPLAYAGAPPAAVNEVQTLTIGGTPTGGTFQLGFEGVRTAAIAWSNVNATLLAALNAAFDAHLGLGVAGCVATAGALTAGIGTILLTFGARWAGQNVSTLTVADNSLTGTTPTLAVAETTPGVSQPGKGAPKGALLIDTANGALYQNTGTPAVPVWTVR
jgi:hypothetical protein